MLWPEDAALPHPYPIVSGKVFFPSAFVQESRYEPKTDTRNIVTGDKEMSYSGQVRRREKVITETQQALYLIG